MVNQYFYAREISSRLGPYSATQLRQLAASGEILPTDTVWKKGVKKGMLAKNLKTLFSAKQTVSDSTETAVSDDLPESTAEVETIPSPATTDPVPEEVNQSTESLPESRVDPVEPEKPATSSLSADVQREKPRMHKAIAVQGAVIVSQDGTYVRYRKKCTQCGHQDNCTSRLAIRNGSNSATYFCPKCRRQQKVELRGSTSY